MNKQDRQINPEDMDWGLPANFEMAKLYRETESSWQKHLDDLLENVDPHKYETSASYAAEKEKEITDILNQTSPTTKKESEALIGNFVQRYVGDKNESRWQSVNYIFPEKRPYRGDDYLTLIMLDFLEKNKEMAKKMSGDFIHSIFTRLIKQLETRIQERMEEEKGKDYRDIESDKVEYVYSIGDGEKSGWNEWNYENNVFLEESQALNFSEAITLGDEGAIINYLIKDLAKYGNRETIDTLLELLEYYGPMVTKYLDGACESIDAPYAAGKILEKIREPKREDESDFDYQARVNDFSRVLNRIELGKIGIDAQVVRYLDKLIYRLQGNREQKDQVDFARRITGDGKIGLFDKQGALTGYFELGDLSDPEIKRDVKTLEISRELLFSSPDTPDNIRQQFLADYTQFYEKVFGEIGGVRMNDLTLREQVWMYKFWKDTNNEEWEKAVKLKEEYGIDGIKVFIATEGDSGIGKKIISFTEEEATTEKIKKKIFAIYGSIVDQLDYVEQHALDFFSEQAKDKTVDTHKITQEIARHAYRELNALLDLAIKGKGVGNKEINEALQDIKTDIIIFASIFKTAFKEKGNLKFKDIEGLNLETKDSSQLTNEEGQEAKKIFYTNRLEVSKEFAQARVEQEFDPVLQSKGHKFYLLKKNGKIVAFARFKELENGNLYVGFLNTKTDIRGMAIGGTFFKTILDIEGQTKPIELKVRTENEKALNWYERDLGFDAIGKSFIDPETKKEYVRMVRPQTQKMDQAA